MSDKPPFGFGPAGGDKDPQNSGMPFNMNDIGNLLQQLGSALQNSSTETGAVNWKLATDAARQAISAAGDPVVSDAQRRAVESAHSTAQIWLNEATIYPAASGTAQAWSRSEWLEATMPAWQMIVEPVTKSVIDATAGIMPGSDEIENLLSEGLGDGVLPPELGELPPEIKEQFGDQLKQFLGPMVKMAQQFGAIAFGMHAGRSVAIVGAEVFSASDVGIPLTEPGVIALVPSNIMNFSEGLGIPEDEVMIYLAAREDAHQRLFSHVPWLRSRLVGAVEEYARGLGVDRSKIEEALGGIDPTDPTALQEAMSSGIFAASDTPEQKAALARIETLLALVEGWVDDVVACAVGGRLGSALALRESLRRRRAAGGPAEKTFATLVGLELRPKLLREASTLWATLREEQGEAAREGLWGHPDLLPAPEDLSDPAGFLHRMSEQENLDERLRQGFPIDADDEEDGK